jgi:putative transposase
MSYWQLYYHVVFATRERRSFPSATMRQAATQLLTAKATELRCTVHALQIQPDHVHIAISIPPTAAVANIVGQLKGSSSHALARMPEGGGFRWQEEYGVLSFGRRNLPEVARYVIDQERRHAQRDVLPELERTGDASTEPNHDHAAPAGPPAGLSRLRERSAAIYGRVPAEPAGPASPTLDGVPAEIAGPAPSILDGAPSEIAGPAAAAFVGALAGPAAPANGAPATDRVPASPPPTSNRRTALHDLDHIPTFATEVEEAAFWDEHELGLDVLERMAPLFADEHEERAEENDHGRHQ